MKVSSKEIVIQNHNQLEMPGSIPTGHRNQKLDYGGSASLNKGILRLHLNDNKEMTKQTEMAMHSRAEDQQSRMLKTLTLSCTRHNSDH